MDKRGSGEESARLTLPVDNAIAASDDYVEITLDVRDELVAVHSVNAASDGTVDYPELTQLGKGLEKKSSFEPSIERNGSSRIQQVSHDLKLLASRMSPPQQERFGQTESAAMQAPKGLKFFSKIGRDDTWAGVEKRFDELSTNGMLPRSLFGKCIGMNKWSDEEFAIKIFASLCRRFTISGDSITKEQLKEFWDQIADERQFQIFLNIVDKDADGRIIEDEVREIISMSASANMLSNIQEHAAEYARLIMEKLDPNNLGYIMIENLEMLLLQGQIKPALGSKESGILSKMLSQKLRPRYGHPLKRWYRDSRHFLLDNWQRVWVMALWIVVMGALFAYHYLQYKNRVVLKVMGHCVCVAKGAAETLKLNMALVLLPMCRNTITWLRNKTKLGAAVPFDDNTNFHKMIAVAIGIGVGVHGISHLACDFPRLVNASEEKYKPMEQFFGAQPSSYWFFLKGWEGATGVVMVILMAITFTLASSWFRRNRVHLPKPLNKLVGFNAFWYSHHLFVIVYALLIIHGVKVFFIHEWYKKTTWMYLAIPISIYAGERLIRAFRSSVKLVKILKVTVYPGNVLALHMSKPQGFKYRSGQYIFVKCAAVSPFEWHPLSLTSAPQDDYLTVHIRTLGDWTRKLKHVFCEERSPTGKNGLLRGDFLEGENNPIFPTVSIDGPYGTSVQEYKNYDVVLLIGLGIGASPMISVVKDIVNNVKAMEDEEDLEGSPRPLSRKTKQRTGSGYHDIKTKRAYFYWITREQGSFDWFKGVMNEVADMDRKGVIEMHNYCTTVYEEGDPRSILIALLQKMEHAKNGVDIVSGTKVKCLFYRPDWRTVYKEIALAHPNSVVGVFYCGAPALVPELKHLALEFSHNTSTKFNFHLHF